MDTSKVNGPLYLWQKHWQAILLGKYNFRVPELFRWANLSKRYLFCFKYLEGNGVYGTAKVVTSFHTFSIPPSRPLDNFIIPRIMNSSQDHVQFQYITAYFQEVTYLNIFHSLVRKLISIKPNMFSTPIHLDVEKFHTPVCFFYCPIYPVNKDPSLSNLQ